MEQNILQTPNFDPEVLDIDFTSNL